MLMGGQLEHNMGGKLEQMKTFVQGEIAKVKATPVPECPVCFMQLKPPNKIVQCQKVGVFGSDFVSPIQLNVNLS